MSSPMTAERLAEIRERAEDGWFVTATTVDRDDLLAEVEWLRGSLADMLETSREMQANVRASVTLAYLQEEIVNILHPMPGESA